MTLLVATGIRKTYGAVVALKDASLRVARGEVHALLGENGAGKSTLVKILAGIERPDSGTIEFEGRPFDPRSPREALLQGVGVVHQHDTLVDALTVAENLELLLARGGAWLSSARLEHIARECAERTGIDLPAHDREVSSLSIGERQRVEIARALATDPRLLVLDEPTALLAPTEAEHLLHTLRQVALRGVGVVFISHYLREVLAVADRVTVLREGSVVRTAPRAGQDADALAHAMVGERPAAQPRSTPVLGPVRIALDSAHTDSALDPVPLRGVSFTVRGGECVGIAGVAGNGQRALENVLAGTLALSKGTLALDGIARSTAGEAVAERRRARLAIVPADRRAEGLAPGLSIAENLLLHAPALQAIATWGIIGMLAPRAVEANAAVALARYGVRARNSRVAAATLSGGNQQRVVLARELRDEPRAALLVQPTRGLDPKATAFVHAEIERLRTAGVAVLLISSDLDEIETTCDRCLVMLRGAVVAEFARGADRQRIGRAMVGAGVVE